MTLDDMKNLAQPEGFRPFVLRTASGKTFDVPHPEFLIIPPGEETDFIEVWELVGPTKRRSSPRWVPLSAIDAIEFTKP